MNDDRIVIDIRDASICFNMSKDKIDSFKEYVLKVIKRQLFYEEFWALKNINIQIKKGEVFGIVGLNGAGKSTLLKMVTGVLKPTTGTVHVEGSISPLIELGAGFDPELTAGENVYMNGAVLGYDMKFMRGNYDAIMDFSELWDFENVAIKNFSSGMYARLGFSIATTVKPEILIVDEILSVGDYKFQKKCEKRIDELMSGGTTVLLVSHSKDTIERFCNRVAWLENGSLVEIGPAQDICRKYEGV